MSCDHPKINKLTLIGGKRTISDYCPLCKSEINIKDLSAQESTETTRHASQNPNQV